MNNQDAQKFIDSGVTEVNVIAIKGEGATDEGYQLNMVAYIQEVSGIVVQCESWDETQLTQELNHSYNALRIYFKHREAMLLPEKLTYIFHYVSEEEFLKN